MSVINKIKLVEHLFAQLDKEINAFQLHAKLDCINGCGKCCNKVDIEATPLEFLPWSSQIYLKGKSHEVLAELNSKQNGECFLYNHLSLIDKNIGNCSDYYHRGLICRLFGDAASRNKYGESQLITCKVIKDLNPKEYKRISSDIETLKYLPICTDYYWRLQQIDFKLGNIIVPINLAMSMAIEEVLNYYSHHPFDSDLRHSA